jgi:hypothetical protein
MQRCLRAGTQLVIAPMAESPRRFPPPWQAEPIPGGYVVRDASGQALAYLYSRGNEMEALQAKVLTKDEPRRIAIKHRVAAGAVGDGRVEKMILGQ